MRLLPLLLMSTAAASPLVVSSGWAADRIQLTSDTELEGQIVQDNPADDYVVLHTGDNAFGIKRKDIRTLTYDTKVRKDYIQRRDDVANGEGLVIGKRGDRTANASSDAAAHYSLGKWAQEKRLFAVALQEYKTALNANPKSTEARKAFDALVRCGDWSDPLIPPPASPSESTVVSATPARTTSAATFDADAFISKAKPKEAAERRNFMASVKDDCNALDPTLSIDPAKQKQLLDAWKKDKTKAGEALAACLDSKSVPESGTRLGALKGIDLLKPVGANISYALATSAVADPDDNVRQSATKLVKSRNDEAAMRQMIGHLMSAYEPSGEPKSHALRDAAVASLRGLGDKRIYQGILYHVWMELRLTNIDEGNLTTRQLDTFAVQNGANASVLVPLALPIQFPELKITRVKTAVIAPAASALRDVTGQDFGQDWDAWAKWVQKQ